MPVKPTPARAAALTGTAPATARTGAARRTGTRLTALLAATLVCGGIPGPARAAGAWEHLFLTVGGADATWVRGVELRCDPASGYHPRAEQACAALAAAHGDIASIATPDDAYAGARRCGRAPDPVTATASGSYRGRPVQWRASYPSPCFLHADTGSLFRF